MASIFPTATSAWPNQHEKPEPGLNHFGFQVGSIPEIEEATQTTAQDNVPGARAEKWIKDPEGNRVDISEDGWPI